MRNRHTEFVVLFTKALERVVRDAETVTPEYLMGTGVKGDTDRSIELAQSERSLQYHKDELAKELVECNALRVEIQKKESELDKKAEEVKGHIRYVMAYENLVNEIKKQQRGKDD